MTTNLSSDAAAEAAQRLLNDRVDAVRALAKARQQRIDARGQPDEAERADPIAYASAQRAGWSTDEPRKVGFEEPERKAPGRPRRARVGRRGPAEGNAQGDGQQ